jgi:hypothetical protein
MTESRKQTKPNHIPISQIYEQNQYTSPHRSNQKGRKPSISMSKAAEIKKIAESQMKKQGKLTASDYKTEKTNRRFIWGIK